MGDWITKLNALLVFFQSVFYGIYQFFSWGAHSFFPVQTSLSSLSWFDQLTLGWARLSVSAKVVALAGVMISCSLVGLGVGLGIPGFLLSVACPLLGHFLFYAHAEHRLEQVMEDRRKIEALVAARDAAKLELDTLTQSMTQCLIALTGSHAQLKKNTGALDEETQQVGMTLDNLGQITDRMNHESKQLLHARESITNAVSCIQTEYDTRMNGLESGLLSWEQWRASQQAFQTAVTDITCTHHRFSQVVSQLVAIVTQSQVTRQENGVNFPDQEEAFWQQLSEELDRNESLIRPSLA